MTLNEPMIMNIPVVPLRGIVIFPKMLMHLDVGRKKSINAINHAMNGDRLIFCSAQFDAAQSQPEVNDLYQMGVVARVIQVVKQPDNGIRVVIEGLYRASLRFVVENQNYLCADIEKIKEQKCSNENTEAALVRAMKSVFENYVELNAKLPSDIMFKVGLSTSASELSDYLAGNLIIDYRNKQ